MKTLTSAPYFVPQTIVDIVGEPGLTRRLREIGFHSGCVVKLLGQAPFNGPYVVQLHDSVMALRWTEAQCLVIE
jgi:ferrous iron transport protein A